MVTAFKKIAALFLIVIYSLSATSSKELLKLPLLAEHYADHRTEGKNTGFFKFLVLHYVVEDGTDSDADEDSRLPFKSAEHAVASFVSVAPTAFVVLNKPVTENSNEFADYHDLFLPSQYLASIWQPPRHC